MIDFFRFELENGLKVLVHEDDSTPMAAINILYDVGARDESPDKTGFAHLFEHLMFSGSENVTDFDDPIQRAGGENNAFTNNDLTNFYDILPAQNIETAFWLESDRMFALNVTQEALDVQRKVVVEEFKETCLNRPYGDIWHYLADLTFKKHPYKWPTIGKVIAHIEEAKIEDVQDFYKKYYCPNNAILVVAGNVKCAQVKALAEKWFGDIPRGAVPVRNLPIEPPQQKAQYQKVEAKVPVDAFYMAFHIPHRMHEDYYVIDLLSDVLSNGRSSRLYRRLLKEQRLFVNIDAYITGSIDPGLLIIEGKPAEGVSMEQAEAAIWRELEILKKELVPKQELEKLKNKIESTLVFSESSVLNKAINLAFFELVGDAKRINEEVKLYEKIQSADLLRIAQNTLTKENYSLLYYKAQAEAAV